MAIPPVQRFLAGFEQGAKAANPKIVVFSDYVGKSDTTAWNNPAGAKTLARAQFAKGADVIFAVAGGSGLGVFEAAKEVKKFAIGVDRNQNGLEPGIILTSVVKRVDTAVFQAAESLKNNRFRGGQHWLGIKEGGIELAVDQYTKKLVKPAVIKEIELVAKKISDGQIKVK